MGANPFIGVLFHWLGGLCSASNFHPVSWHQALELGSLLDHSRRGRVADRAHLHREPAGAGRFWHPAPGADIGHRVGGGLSGVLWGVGEDQRSAWRFAILGWVWDTPLRWASARLSEHWCRRFITDAGMRFRTRLRGW